MSSCSDLTKDLETLDAPETLEVTSNSSKNSLIEVENSQSSCDDNTKTINSTSQPSQNSNPPKNPRRTSETPQIDTAVASVMDTLTYENCAASFFTNNKYTNLPYNILGQMFDSENDVKLAVEARSWFTYRSGFSKIGNSNLTSDAGWGCAVRVGQMLLSEVFNRLKNSDRQVNPDHDVLEKFLDTDDSPFSLQKLVLAFSREDDSKIGTWLGPNNVCHSIKQLVSDFNEKCSNSSSVDTENPVTEQPGSEPSTSKHILQVHVCMDSTVVIPELPKVEISPILIFIPLRLGLDSINSSLYGQDILNSISYPQSVGIIGGRPRTAYYFFGHSETTKELLALDPHTVRAHSGSVDEADNTCDSPLFIKSVEHLDPTMALGFLARTQVELDDLIHRLSSSKLCAIMRELPNMDFEFKGDLDNLDVDLPDTDDEFEILC
jgi:cysteine protease ATG4